MKLTKKTLCVFLSLLLAALPLAGFTAFAVPAAVVAEGFCGADEDGRNLSWTLTEDGVLTISGEGAMADYRDYSLNPGTPEEETVEVLAPWYEWIYADVLNKFGYGSIAYCEAHADEIMFGPIQNALYDRVARYMKRVVIAEGVTTVGIEAFAEWYAGGELRLPSTLVSVGDDAFYRGRYTSLVLPEGLESVGKEAFARLHITDLTIPSTLQTLGEGAFSQLPWLQTVTVNNASFDVTQLYVPSFEGEAVYRTFEEYEAASRLQEYFGLVHYLLNYDMTYAANYPYLIAEGRLPAVAEDYIKNVMYSPAMLRDEFDIEGDTREELMENALTGINAFLGTDFAPAEIAVPELTPVFKVDFLVAVKKLPESPALARLYDSYMWRALEIGNYMAEHQCTEAEANTALGGVLTVYFEELNGALEVNVTTLQEAQDALIARINADTGMEFTAADIAYYTRSYGDYSEAYRAALAAKYGLAAEDLIRGGRLYLESLEDLTRENCQYVAAPWVTVRCCLNKFKDTVEAAGVRFVSGDHTFVSRVTAAATCMQPGERLDTCVCCGYAVPVQIPRLEHIAGGVILQNEVPVTCTTDGSYDEVLFCSLCGYPISTTHHTVEALGHNWGEWEVITQATETSTGLMRRTCLNDPTHVEEVVIPVLELDDDGNPIDAIWAFIERFIGRVRGIIDWFLRLFGRP